MRRIVCLVLLALPALFAIPTTSFAGEAEDPEEEDDPGTIALASASTKAAPVVFDRRWLEPFFATGPASKAAVTFHAGDFASASKELGRIISGLAGKSPERNPLRFLYALALMNQSSWQAAGDIFEDLWSSYPLLAPYHAYYAARCRLRRGELLRKGSQH